MLAELSCPRWKILYILNKFEWQKNRYASMITWKWTIHNLIDLKFHHESYKTFLFLRDHAILRWLSKWRMVTTERNIRTNQSTAQGRENEKKTYFPGIIPTVGDVFMFVLFQSGLSVIPYATTEPFPRNALEFFPFPDLLSWSVSFLIL